MNLNVFNIIVFHFDLSVPSSEGATAYTLHEQDNQSMDIKILMKYTLQNSIQFLLRNAKGN